MNHRLANIFVILVIFAAGAWFGFKSYLLHNKAESQVEKSELTVSGNQETTDAGVSINTLDHLSGLYKSVKTDPPSTEVLFKTYGTTETQGTFKELEVSATFGDPDNSIIHVTIDPASVYTAESTRDKHIKGEGFFDIEKYSTIDFLSNELIKSDSSYIAKGNITFLGNTKPLDIPFKYLGSASGKENVEIFEGKFSFNPIPFGMGEDAGENVTVTFYTELLKQ